MENLGQPVKDALKPIQQTINKIKKPLKKKAKQIIEEEARVKAQRTTGWKHRLYKGIENWSRRD